MAFKDNALEGKVALVTGGSRGIGRAICLSLSGRGALVAINYRSNKEAALETKKNIEDSGGKAVLVEFDVADAEQSKSAIESFAKDHGGLHILVNNAGVAINGLLMRFKSDDWNKVIDINLKGAFNCAKAASRYLLKARKDGRIINISSVVGETGNGGQVAYASAKSGLLGLTKSLAKELAGRGVCVNAVTPGFIETDMTAEHLPEDQKAKLLETIPLGQIGQPQDVANAVAFLAGPEASYITGHVLKVNGGLSM